MTFDPIQLYDWAAKIGFPAGMAIFIWALHKGHVVMGNEFRRVLLERDEFKRMVLTGQQIAVKALSVADKSVSDKMNAGQ